MYEQRVGVGQRIMNRLAFVLSPTPERAMAISKEYDPAWYLRFLRLADQEDMADTGVGDAMKVNGWVNAAVMFIARNVSRVPFKLWAGEEEIETGDVWSLFNEPNPYMSRSQLWEATEAWLKCRGEAFWTFEAGYTYAPAGGRLPTEIWVQDPDQFKHVLDPKDKKITLWWYRSGREEIPFMPDEIMHFRVWNKWDPFRGVNPLVAIGDEIDTDKQATVLNKKLIKNGSRPEGLLHTQQRLSEDQAKEIQERWEKGHKGPTRAGRIAVLGAGTEYQQISLGPKDMEYLDLRKLTRNMILSVYGVPPAALGVYDDKSPLSGADTEQQIRMFWTTRLLPDLRAIEDKVKTLFKRCGVKGVEGRFDEQTIPELQKDDSKQSEQDLREISVGLILINEVREARGKEPLPWGDVWWAPPFVQPIGNNGKGEEAPVLVEPPKNVTPRKLAVEFERITQPRRIEIPARKTVWPKTWRDGYREKTLRRRIVAEKKFRKDIEDWLYRQRAALITDVLQPQRTMKVEIGGDDAFWKGQLEELKKLANQDFTIAVNEEGKDLAAMFEEMGLPNAVRFDIWDTGALHYLDQRVNRGKLGEITDTIRGRVRDQIETGLREGRTEVQIADDIRDVYAGARGRAATIARTEMGGILGDSRFAAFEAEGFEYHSWLSAGDELVRRPDKYCNSNHAIDGEVTKMGEPFAGEGTGLRYPNDPNGEACSIINCRCVDLPEPSAEGGGWITEPGEEPKPEGGV
jgi:HK97 family phage portal protein